MKTQTGKNNSLLLARIILTVSIIAISVASFYFITVSSNVLLLSSRIGKITSNQRTLCSQVVNSMAADNIGGKLTGPPLEKTLAEFAKSDTLFFNADSALNMRLGRSDLNDEYIGLKNAYDSLLSSISVNLSSDSPNHFVDLLTAENNYLLKLDNYASALNSLSNKEVQTFKFRETTILFISLLCVLLEIVFLFLPAVRKIKKQNDALMSINNQLEESHKLLQAHVTEIEDKNKRLKKVARMQSHDIRQPLTSVIALVNFIKEGHAVDEHWLQMMYDASNCLDARIQSIIRESEANEVLKMARSDKQIDVTDEYAIVLLDAEGNIRNWNEGAEKVFGYKGHEVLDKNFSLFYTEHDKNSSHFYYLLETANQSGSVRDEAQQVRKDSSSFFASTLIRAMHNNRGDEVVGYTCIMRPLTDAKLRKQNVHNRG